MGYTATVIEIMIASPRDVSKERDIIRDVIGEWNAINARDRKIVLLPLSWETHASPEMGDRPQEFINRQLLYGADLLIAVFWTRLGSPTGIAQSGTAEEIEKHLAAGKPAMIYFSSTSLPPDDVDAEQHSALKRFKDSCKEKGLIEEYETPEQFKKKFSRQLAQKVIEHFTNPSVGSDDIGQPLEPETVSFLSDTAQELLLEASRANGGVIYVTNKQVMTNGRKFVEPGDHRSEAQWRAAIRELKNKGLVEDQKGDGNIFEVTGEGYQLVDSLKGS